LNLVERSYNNASDSRNSRRQPRAPRRILLARFVVQERTPARLAARPGRRNNSNGAT
jgi:hypothetical protein